MDQQATPLSPLALAHILAKDSHLYIVKVTEKKGDAWVVYRQALVPGERGVRLGRRNDPGALLHFIRKLIKERTDVGQRA